MKNYALKLIATTIISLLLIFDISAQDNQNTKSSFEFVLASDVEWTYLNPARKDKAPMAATLWGDRNGSEATGFLLKPSDGFESPPHIHNVSYRGIVISGLIHNDDPDAANMWMPAGSFWTQPKGEVHITAAKGTNTFAYIEIDEGPYLVLPPEEEFDSGERPVNVDETNIVWLDASDITWIDQSGIPSVTNEPKVAFLWEDKQDSKMSGSLVRFPAGFIGKIISHASTFRAVVIKGELQLSVKDEQVAMEAGSYIGAIAGAKQQIVLKSSYESIIYVRTNDKYNVLTDK